MSITWIYQRSPNVILQTDNSPGDSWAMDGSRDFLIIKLFQPSCPAFLLMDHRRKEMAPTTAPQNLSVYGFKKDIEIEEGTFLGSFLYNISLDRCSNWRDHVWKDGNI
nr:PREDICTED: SUN domain-containing protein 3-like [Anolis carolinensis]|eukprot:XP_008116987.1 PREDICTED: SUN domain-containing protein 3-like [Anolis carolinensis]